VACERVKHTYNTIQYNTIRTISFQIQILVRDSKRCGDYSGLRPTQTLGAAFGTARASGGSLNQFGWRAQLRTAFQGGLYPLKADIL